MFSTTGQRTAVLGVTDQELVWSTQLLQGNPFPGVSNVPKHRKAPFLLWMFLWLETR